MEINGCYAVTGAIYCCW